MKTPREHYEATDQRMETLPKWARGLIEYLERELSYTEDQRDALTATEQPEGSLISWSQGINDDKWLPKHTSIRCHFDRHRHIDVRFRGGHSGDPLLLDINGSTTLLVKPQASNSIYLNIEER